jgi:hypothetical protein
MLVTRTIVCRYRRDTSTPPPTGPNQVGTLPVHRRTQHCSPSSRRASESPRGAMATRRSDLEVVYGSPQGCRNFAMSGTDLPTSVGPIVAKAWRIGSMGQFRARLASPCPTCGQVLHAKSTDMCSPQPGLPYDSDLKCKTGKPNLSLDLVLWGRKATIDQPFSTPPAKIY